MTQHIYRFLWGGLILTSGLIVIGLAGVLFPQFMVDKKISYMDLFSILFVIFFYHFYLIRKIKD